MMLISVSLLSTSCVGYVAEVGYGQMKILMKRRSFEDVLSDPTIAKDTKKKIQHVMEVRHFAEKELFLNIGDTYNSYADIERSAASYNVTASEELKFQAKTWWFPIIGTVPYLGFFDHAEAEEKGLELEKEGWDVRVRSVSAYSTLGWFNDPLLSSQIVYSDYYLTRLVIHESAHRTIWFSGDVNFNESFASFVEKEGARIFYEKKHGKDSQEMDKFKKGLLWEKEERELYHNYAARLNDLYGSSSSDDEKRITKVSIIKDFRKDMVLLYRKFGIPTTKFNAEFNYNNADFLSSLRYHSGGDFFMNKYIDSNKDWGIFYKKMKKLQDMDAEERNKLLLN